MQAVIHPDRGSTKCEGESGVSRCLRSGQDLGPTGSAGACPACVHARVRRLRRPRPRRPLPEHNVCGPARRGGRIPGGGRDFRRLPRAAGDGARRPRHAPCRRPQAQPPWISRRWVPRLSRLSWGYYAITCCWCTNAGSFRCRWLSAQMAGVRACTASYHDVRSASDALRPLPRPRGGESDPSETHLDGAKLRAAQAGDALRDSHVLKRTLCVGDINHGWLLRSHRPHFPAGRRPVVALGLRPTRAIKRALALTPWRQFFPQNRAGQ